MYYFGHALCLLALLLFESGQSRMARKEMTKQAGDQTKEEKDNSTEGGSGLGTKREADMKNDQSEQRNSTFVAPRTLLKNWVTWNVKTK